MTIRDRREMKQTAAQALDRATCNPKRLVLIHAGVTVAIFLLTILVTRSLEAWMDENAGLSGLGIRGMLGTAGEVLSLAASLFSPFWAIGFLATMLHIIRNKYVSPRSLLLGFRNFGPVLRLTLLQAFLAMMVVMVTVPVASILFALLPQGAAMVEAVNNAAATDAAQLMAIPAVQEAAWVILALFLVVFLALYIPLAYRLRMSRYVLMDVPGMGAIAATVHSFRMTKGSCFQLFRLDLSFWWYYLALALVSTALELPLLLSALGTTLPLSGNMLLLISAAVYSLGYLAVYYLAAGQVQATYAVAYEVISGPYRAPAQPSLN